LQIILKSFVIATTRHRAVVKIVWSNINNIWVLFSILICH